MRHNDAQRTAHYSSRMHASGWLSAHSVQVIILLCYALATPLGIAIGVGVSSTYDPHSLTARAVIGVLNGVAGGMLLGMGLPLIMTEFNGPACKDMRLRQRLLLLLAVLLGGVFMAVLAIWA
jgi:zinc transporter 1/2/3